jgi:hypothetical protein
VREHLIRALALYRHGGVQKGYPVTDLELDAVVALYDQYDGSSGAPHPALLGPVFAEALKNEVRDGYRFFGDDMRLADVRASLMRGVGLCPICGITAVGELDHHLPKASYRLLAIYVRNLVPHCHDCNHRKSMFVGQNPTDRFIQVYLEPLPPVQFLQATVSLAQGGLDVDYSIDQAAVLPPMLIHRLTNQFGRLKLNERYGREVNTYMTGHTVGLHDAYNGGAGGVQSYLQRQAAVEARSFHINHWRPVLLGALGNHAAFCDNGFAAVLPRG